MNVLYVTANSHLRSTASSLNAIIQQLKTRGVRPVMWFGEPGPWQQKLADEGVTTIVAPFVRPDKRAPIASAINFWRIVRLLRREKISLVHCNEHELYPALRRSVRYAGVPTVVSLHWNLEPGFGRWAFGPPYMPAALQFTGKAQLEISRGSFPAELPPDRVQVLWSGLDIDFLLKQGSDGRDLRRQWGAGDETVVLGVAAAIKPRKHLEDFVRMIGRLRREGRPVLGVIAGGGQFADADYVEAVQEVIAEEQLQPHCKMIGNLDPITPFFKAVDIAVNPSEMEILSISMCEAQACGRPLIAYAVGGNPETVYDPWCVVPFGDVDALTDRARALVDDPALRRSHGEAALRHVRKHFDAPVLAQRQAVIYCKVLGESANTVWPEGACQPILTA